MAAKKTENNMFSKPTAPAPAPSTELEPSAPAEDRFPRTEPKVIPTDIVPAERDASGNRVIDPVIAAAASKVATTPIDETLSAARKIDEALGHTVQPMSTELIEKARADLIDLSPEEQLELAVAAHETIGKAAGYLPDFHSLSENMKAAYLKIVRDVHVYAQRKVRKYNE